MGSSLLAGVSVQLWLLCQDLGRAWRALVSNTDYWRNDIHLCAEGIIHFLPSSEIQKDISWADYSK